ncbi:hypothetical protein JOC75_001019 [Metabacillus crassostreae]|uniref:hypothetical protein n=1 Tax=Metabacillus crassostreae TaxID=929098 RepID=UPI00195833C8|nr:hypothetical protein [Metabacillus crassostreae]MBM7603049.1 hypothetical protein [Metabacillus crassostreae]
MSVSILVNDVLNKHYGLIPATSLSNSELRKVIFEEVSEFVKAQREEFDLNKASRTYREIDMVYSGKPSAIKAQIGREFNNNYVGRVKPFVNVKQVMLPNGKPKKTIKNRAAIYAIDESSIEADE